jgi:ankyrin repeat protein
VDKEIVQLLLDDGANVDADGGYNGTALQGASIRGRKKIVQLLLDNGANVDADGGYNGTALQGASIRGRKKIVQLLLDKRAKRNVEGGLDSNQCGLKSDFDILRSSSTRRHLSH